VDDIEAAADELLSLCRALRSTPDHELQDALKRRFDIVIEWSRRALQSTRESEYPRKLDA
jgi:hypothetical protein